MPAPPTHSVPKIEHELAVAMLMAYFYKHERQTSWTIMEKFCGMPILHKYGTLEKHTAVCKLMNTHLEMFEDDADLLIDYLCNSVEAEKTSAEGLVSHLMDVAAGVVLFKDDMKTDNPLYQVERIAKNLGISEEAFNTLLYVHNERNKLASILPL